MSNVQRWVSGNLNSLWVTVHSGITVELGDLMFLNNQNNLMYDGSSTADNLAYPIEYLRTSGASLELNKHKLKEVFIGVAMDDKDGVGDSGNTKNISIATSGKFKFDLKPAKTVYAGSFFGATGTSSASDLFNQKIMKTSDTTSIIGVFAEYKVHATEAEVYIKSAFKPPGSIYWKNMREE